MKARIVSTLALWIVIIGVVAAFRHLGGIALLAIATALAQLELYALMEVGGKAKPMKALGTVLGAGVILGSYFLPAHSAMEVPAIAVILLSLTLLNTQRVGQRFLPTLFGLVYLPFLLQFYGLMLAEWNSLFLPIWVIAVAKFSDVGGLLVGKKFGRTKLAPAISPGKTIEGAVGGVLSSALVGVVLLLLFKDLDPFGMTIFKTALTGALIGALAIVSDLIESQLKRWAGVKDSGALVPGIGGVFDLIDSLVLVGPVAYLLFQDPVLS